MFIITLSEIIGLVILAVLFLSTIGVSIKTAYKQRKCKHLSYRENMACDAICKDCGKNLGFIGNIREGGNK